MGGVNILVHTDGTIAIKELPQKEIVDYKLFCFNGKVKFLKVDFGRFTSHHANYYSPEGTLLPFCELSYPSDVEANISLPSNLNTMIHLAERLSEDKRFLRVDFYNCNGSILFGELTFYPASGLGKISPDSYDYRIGKILKLD